MDYDDNDFQSQNLHLAGEGNTNCPPVLRPYALPKFDFDDSLQGHLRFDSLVETEVFLGIESNETNHWIEDFSRGSSGIDFNSSAAESCSISRCNNVWSEATSSESVEMLLKSVGQEENIPAKIIFEELDACKDLHCLTKQMEPNFSNDDSILSQMGDVTESQPTLTLDEIPENPSGLEDGVDQLWVEDASQTHEGKLSVDGNSGDLDPNAVSGKDSPHVTKGYLLVDGKCNDANQKEFDNLVDEPPDKREDSSASGMQVDDMMTSVPNITTTSEELNNKDVQQNINSISEMNPDGHVLSIETQNMNEKAVEKATCHLGNPHCPVSEVESLEVGVANQGSVNNSEEPSGMILQADSSLHTLGGCSDKVCPGVLADSNKCEDMDLSKGTDVGIDQSKVNTHQLSPIAYKIHTGYAVELSNRNAEIFSGLDPTLKADSDLHMVDGCSDRECPGVPAETKECENMKRTTDTGGDHSKLNTRDLSPVVYSSDDKCVVEASNSNTGISSSLDSVLKVDSEERSSKENASESSFQPDSEICVRKSEVSLSVIQESEVSKDQSDENKEVHSSLTATVTSAEMLSEVHVTGGSKSFYDTFRVYGEKLNVDGHASFSLLGECAQMCDEDVCREGDGGDGNLDLSYREKDGTRLLNESNSTNLEFGGSVGKELRSSSCCEGSTEKELIVPKLKHDDGNESVANISLEKPELASCGTMDAFPFSSGNREGINVANHSEVQAATSPDVGPYCDKQEETENKMSKDGSFSCIVSSALVETVPGSVSEAEKGSSCDNSGPLLCKTVDQSLPVTDNCNTECQNEPLTAVADEVSKRSTNEMEVSSVQYDSSEKDGDGAGATIKDSSERANVTGPVLNCDMNVTELGPSPLAEICGGTAEKVMEDTDTVVSGVKSGVQATLPRINSGDSRIYEGSTCSAPFPESHTRFDAPVGGGSSVDPSKPNCDSSKVVGITELSETKHELPDIKGPRNQSAPVSATVGDGGNRSPNSWNPNGNDAFKDLRNSTLDVNLFVDLPKVDAANSLQCSPAIPAPKIVEGSKAQSGSVLLDAKISQDIFGGPLVSGGEIPRGGSKGTPERKTRRVSSKATGKHSATKGSVKAKTPMRQSESESGDKSSSVSLSQSGIFQLVHPGETQPYGHVDGSIKPYSVTTSTSSLPDLNTSAPPSVIFQQPFTDLQQVQLRAQIFVYGALIQGMAPEEAYMVSAFGGPDGGRGMWENSWRVCIERLHGKKSSPNQETPLQSHSGSRASDQVIKQDAFHSKGISSPVGRANTKGTPPMASPMIPISSPLWSIPTPVCEGLQYSMIPRGSAVDYQPAFNSLHPFQTPPARNLVGHNTTWMPQSSFRGPWFAPPESSAEASIHFSAFPSTEAVQLTPVKETSSPQLAIIKHVPAGPSAQTGGPTSVFAGASALAGPKKVSASPGQHSADPKPRKRKKILASEELGQGSLQAQPQPESALTLSITARTTPSTLESKATSESFFPTSSSDHLKKVDLDLEQRATLTEDTLSKVEEARQQAEEAAALAAAAVCHSQEIWNQLDKQKNSRLISDGEAKLASAAVAVAAAAAVSKAAAAAANVASNAALQAKLMAEEALVSYNYENSNQSAKVATPVSILRGDEGTNSSSSILVAAREAARRRIEAASAASKRAENMDAIVKAAELAAEAVTQAGIIVAMGDPLPLSELAEAGPVGYWKLPQVSSEIVTKSNHTMREQSNLGAVGEDANTSGRCSKYGQSDKKEAHPTALEKSPIPKEVNKESADIHLGLISNSPLITVENDFEKEPQVSEESGIKEGSQVEVLKDGSGFAAAWFTADVLSLQDGKACVRYTVLQSKEGKLQEWVALEGQENKSPKIRIARPVTAMGYEGTRKRRRAAMADYSWSVGDKVDAWIQESWWEGVITEKNKKDETVLTVHFPAQGEKSVVKAWHLRPSLIWKDGEWVEWFSVRNDCSSLEGDMPQEKRPKLGNPSVEGKGEDKTSASIDVDSGKPEEPRLLNLSANEKVFNMGKNTRTENKPDATRTVRTGLQKEGPRVVFGIPKPGKKRKFMEVSKHYVANQSNKSCETNDSVKSAKYLMPQGSGSRGLKNTSTRSAPNSSSEMDHTGKIDVSGKHALSQTGSTNRTEGTTQGPIVFSSLAPSSDVLSSKKVSASTAKSLANKGKLAPAGGKLGKIEEGKVFSGYPAKSTSEVVEPRRSIRRIQPTSRLLEGLQSSLIISKIPSASHDKGHRSQNRNASRGNNNG